VSVMAISPLLSKTARDMAEGVSAWRLWSTFGWHDLQARFRRSWIGPLWLMLSAAVFMAALSIVYATLFKIALGAYLPFVAVGVSVWGFLAAVTSESTLVFVESESFIRQTRINLFVYVFRVLWRNIIVFCHQFVVTLVVLILANNFFVTMIPLAFFGLALLFAQALWMLPLFGLIGARFRDAQVIIQNLLQVAFFITPVFWPAASLGSRRWLADLNPLNSLIDVVREPLLGRVPTLQCYSIVLAVTFLGLLTSSFFYGRFSKRLVYWL